VIRHNITGVADLVEALEEEIEALTALDPYQPQITLLRERLNAAIGDMYEMAPRGV
jgi:hypothetical protein